MDATTICAEAVVFVVAAFVVAVALLSTPDCANTFTMVILTLNSPPNAQSTVSRKAIYDCDCRKVFKSELLISCVTKNFPSVKN